MSVSGSPATPPQLLPLRHIHRVSILTLSDVAVEFGATPLFGDVGFSVQRGERWGLVGRNGTGKTTLFRVITGEQAVARGTVVRASELRIAALDQFRDFGDAATVWEAAAAGYRHLLELETSLEEQAVRLSELGDAVSEGDLARYGKDQEAFQREGGYEFRARVDAVLEGVGFDPEEARIRDTAGLSGGERGRIGLAAQLAAPADLLLLDEPTNHLDLDTIDWLKEYLREIDEAVMVISHDRAFLDDGVDRILHVHGGTTTEYRGGYSAFAMQRAERALVTERQIKAQQKHVAKEEEYIRRHIAGQNSAQAKGRRKRLARLPRISPPPSEADAMALRFEARERGGDQVVIVDDLEISIEGRALVTGFSAIARRGDVIAVVGPNGAGKSTLLSTLLGRRAPDGGEARLGASITASWFQQDLAQIPMDRSVYDCVADLRGSWSRGQVQGHLGRFGFSGDEVLLNTSKLSGGERARVALALMTLSGANLLVLDEPTNHLDVESIEALEDALEVYPGTVLLVSHDRAMLRELATRVWAIEAGTIVDFPGPFVDWEVRRREKAEREEVRAREAVLARQRDAASDRRNREARNREGRKERARLRKLASESEEQVHALEAKVAELEAALHDESLHDGSAEGAHEAARIHKELTAVREELEVSMERWMSAEEALAEG